MSGFFMHTLEIKEYNRYLVIKVAKRTPKLRSVGTGTALINFNKYDIQISREAADILKSNIATFDNTDTPVLEIMSSSSLWYLGTQGLIIPPGEIFHIYEMPEYTECDNEIDVVLKNTINKA